MLDWNRIQGLRISNQANSESLNSLKASLKQSTSESPVKIDEDVPELTRNKLSGKNYLKNEIINCCILNCDINRYKFSISLFFARGMFFALKYPWGDKGHMWVSRRTGLLSPAAAFLGSREEHGIDFWSPASCCTCLAFVTHPGWVIPEAGRCHATHRFVQTYSIKKIKYSMYLEINVYFFKSLIFTLGTNIHSNHI